MAKPYDLQIGQVVCSRNDNNELACVFGIKIALSGYHRGIREDEFEVITQSGAIKIITRYARRDGSTGQDDWTPTKHRIQQSNVSDISAAFKQLRKSL